MSKPQNIRERGKQKRKKKKKEDEKMQDGDADRSGRATEGSIKWGVVRERERERDRKSVEGGVVGEEGGGRRQTFYSPKDRECDKQKEL